MTKPQRKWLSYYLFFTMAVSSIVRIEPAMYDLLMFMLFIITFLLTHHTFRKSTVFPLTILSIFLTSNLLLLFFIEDVRHSIVFTVITFYLALTWVALVSIASQLSSKEIDLIVKGYLFSALLSAVVGILSYFHFIPLSEIFLLFGRAKAFFKDPNVFGPFLILPAIYAISKVEQRELTMVKKSVYFLFFLLILMGVIVSFSRAAWGNLAISLFTYLLIFKKQLAKQRLKTVVILLLVGGPLVLIFIQTPMVEQLFLTRVTFQNYDNDRFDTQRQVLSTGFSNPFGIGPGQSDEVFRYSPHSLYARVFTENGLFGLVSFVLFYLLSVFKCFQSYWRTNRENGILYIVIFASLIGILFNSFFIDTLHWRHLWVILALAWIPPLEMTEEK